MYTIYLVWVIILLGAIFVGIVGRKTIFNYNDLLKDVSIYCLLTILLTVLGSGVVFIFELFVSIFISYPKTTTTYHLIPIEGKYIFTNSNENSHIVKFSKSDTLLIMECNNLEFCDSCTDYYIEEVKTTPKPSNWIEVPATSYSYSVLVPINKNERKVLEQK